MCNESDSPDAAVNIEDAYPLIDESFREDWESPGMEEYDRYDERGRIKMLTEIQYVSDGDGNPREAISRKRERS